MTKTTRKTPQQKITAVSSDAKADSVNAALASIEKQYGVGAIMEMNKDNIVDIIMKDTHTFRNEPERLKKWCRIAKEFAYEYE